MSILEETPSLRRRLGGSRFAKALVIAFLVLLLLIPIAMIEGLVSERRATRDAAVAEVSATWGGPQRIEAPVIAVPWREWRMDRNGKPYQSEEWGVFVPTSQAVDARLRVEERSRGIFRVPVYLGSYDLSGRFDKLDPRRLAGDSAEIQWDRAVLLLHIQEPRALADTPDMRWNGHPLSFQPGLPPGLEGCWTLHAPLPDPPRDGAVDWKLRLALRGARNAEFVPLAQTTSVRLTSDWKDPSFQGATLPLSSKIDDKGFSAEWKVLPLSRPLAASWKLSDAPASERIAETAFGVSLIQTVDSYNLTDRTLKYAILFLALGFLWFFLFEIFHCPPIHPVQYLLVGSAMALFYLLLLSLSEQLPFDAAYGIAALATSGLLGAYAWSVLRTGTRAVALFAATAGLYGFLLVLLHQEDFALLLGSTALFAILAGVMWLTRRVDWYAGANTAPAAPRPTE